MTDSVNTNTEDIATLNSKSSYTLTSVDSSVFALNRTQCYRYGNFVTLSFDCTAQQAVSSAASVNLVQLPSAIIPQSVISGTQLIPASTVTITTGTTTACYTCLARLRYNGGTGYIYQNATNTIASGARITIMMCYYLD